MEESFLNQDVQFNDYQILEGKMIGFGAFAKVYKAINKQTKQVVACKEILIRKYNEDNFNSENEIIALMKVQSRNIVQFYEFQYTNDKLYIFMEYSKDGDLAQYLKKIHYSQSILKTLQFLRQIVEGYKSLFEQNIIHRDIKLENILMFDHAVKIADFGTAKLLNPIFSIEYSNKGTIGYQSPQLVICQQGNPYDYSYKTDIFSLGVLFYFMIYGEYPWNCKFDSIYQIYNEFNKVQQQGGIRNYLKFKPYQRTLLLDRDIQECILSMLEFDEEKRLSFDELYNHKIFEQLNQRTLIERRFSKQFCALMVDENEKNQDLIEQFSTQDDFNDREVPQSMRIQTSNIEEVSFKNMEEIFKSIEEKEYNKKINFVCNYLKYSIKFCIECWNNFNKIEERRQDLMKYGLTETKLDLLQFYLKKIEFIKYQELESQITFYDFLPYFLQKQIGSKSCYQKMIKSKELIELNDQLEKNIKSSNNQYQAISQVFLNKLQTCPVLSENQKVFLQLLSLKENKLNRYTELFTQFFERIIIPIMKNMISKNSTQNIQLLRTMYSLQEIYTQIKTYDDYTINYSQLKQNLKRTNVDFYKSQFKLLIEPQL